jgi:hypothetical protein
MPYVQCVLHEQGSCAVIGLLPAPFSVDAFGTLLTVGSIQELIVFGSWVRRWMEEPTLVVHDLDILIVGSVDRRVAYEAIRRIELQTGLPVDSVFLRPEEINIPADPFLAELLESPHNQIWRELPEWT